MKKQPFQIAAKRRAKRCYELAGRGVLESDAVTLVHGEVNLFRFAGIDRADNIRIGHAWLTGDDFVYDAVLDEFFTPADYYVRFAAASIHVYTGHEAAVLLTETGHFGPWE